MKDLFSAVMAAILIFLVVVMWAGLMWDAYNEEVSEDCDLFGKVVLDGKLYECRRLPLPDQDTRPKEDAK